MKSATLNRESFESAVGNMPDDALSALRQSAAQRFADGGFPSTRDEDWKYTSLLRATELSNDWLQQHEPSKTPCEMHSIMQALDAHWIVIQNGVVDLAALDLPIGVTARSLASGDSGRSPVFQDNPMSQFNLALLTDGLILDISDGAVIDKPIGLLIQDDASAGTTLSQYRVIVNAGDASTASLIEAHVSDGEHEHFANGVVQLSLSANAKVNVLRVQERARHHLLSGQCIASLASGAELSHASFDLGGSMVRNDLVVELNGRDTVVHMNGLYLAGDQQHVDNHTRVDHRVGPSHSNELYRGILNRRARCVFNGKAVVHEGADGTDAQQANNNLLMSPDAEIDTKPELEIYADDVKCSHGATVGQLDATALFYLRTRGIDEAAAKAMITRAFAAEILGLNPVPQAAEYLAATIDRRLDTLIGDDLHE